MEEDLDKTLAETPEEEVLEYPKVFDTPKGWPSLFGALGGAWYQRALNTEATTGKRVLPLGYKYDDDNKVVKDPDYEEENGK